MTEPGTELATIAQATTPSEMDNIARLGQWLALVESKSTDIKAKGAGNALRIAYARSLGLPDHAASEIHIINGTLATSAQIKRAQAFTQGYNVLPTEETPDSCTVVITERKTGAQVGDPVTFTLADAKRMGLLDKPGKAWHQTPADMLFARASSRAIKRYIPHVALGMVTVDEAEDYAVTVDEVEVVEPFVDGD